VGLIAEASPIFSLGYGEDDDKETDLVSLNLDQVFKDTPFFSL
jgi:hypothetical protein